MDYSRINDQLNSPAQPIYSNVQVSVVSLGGVSDYTVTAGMTVDQFKNQHGLTGTKIVNENGDTLNNNDIITSNMQVFVSTPKKNG